MGNVISNLKAKFGVETSDFKKGLKDGEKAVGDFKGAAGDQINQFAEMFGVNMGGVSDAVGTASKSLNMLKQGFVAAAKGGDILTISAKFLKFALVSTGLGAIVVVLGTIMAYFMKSGEGADKFAKILAQVKSVVNNVIDRLAIFGKGLWQIMSGKFAEGWKTMTGAFKGMGDEIKEDWKAAGKLADAEDALEDREIALINSLSDRKAKSAELRQQAKEEVENQKKKLDLLNQAEALTKGVYKDQIELEKERLRIMQEKLAIQSSDPTDDQNREIAEQQAKINDLLRSQAEELKALNKEKKTALEFVKEELALEKAKASQIAITNADISNIKMPDFSQVSNALAPLAKVQQTIKTVTVNLAESVNSAFTSAASSIGQFLGALASGNEGAGDFVKVVGGIFADLAITVGNVIIAAAIAKMALDKALISFGGAGFALAAGIALVAIGSAVKGSLSHAQSGGGVSSMTGGGSAMTYDTRTNAAKTQNIQITGQLVAKGSDLVYVFDRESTRRKVVNGR